MPRLRTDAHVAGPLVLPIDTAAHGTPAGLRATLDLAPIGLAQFDLAGRFLYANDRLCGILGCAPQALIEQTFQQITFPDDLPHCLELTARLAAGELENYRLDKRFVRADGTVVWARITVSAVRGPDGAVSFFIGAAEDITREVEAAAALRAADERLRTALDASQIGTFRFDVRRNALDWADGLDRVFGTSAYVTLEEFFGGIHPDDRAQVMASYQRSAADGSDFEEEFRAIWPDGSVHWLHDRARMVAGADGAPHYILGAITDITNHRRMKEIIATREHELQELLEREREARAAAEREAAARQQVLGFVAHDLRNPLQAVVAAASLLLLPAATPEQRTRPAGVIRRSALEMDRLIADLLDATRIQSGTFAVRHELFAVSALVSDVAETFQKAAHEAGVALEVRLPHGAEMLDGDRQRLSQALCNLLRNAIAFTPSGGRVSLDICSADSHLDMIVSDSGRGIAPEHLPSVFDHFWQASRTEGGAGLGLAIVKGIVDAHRGEIAVESALGRGTTFRLRLPRRASTSIARRPIE